MGSHKSNYFSDANYLLWFKFIHYNCFEMPWLIMISLHFSPGFRFKRATIGSWLQYLKAYKLDFANWQFKFLAEIRSFSGWKLLRGTAGKKKECFFTIQDEFAVVGDTWNFNKQYLNLPAVYFSKSSCPGMLQFPLDELHDGSLRSMVASMFLNPHFTPGWCECMPGSTSSETASDFTAHLAETLGDGVWVLNSKP